MTSVLSMKPWCHHPRRSSSGHLSTERRSLGIGSEGAVTQTSERELRFEDRMRDADALAWSIEKDPMLRSTIITVLVLDRAPDRTLMAERLERGSRLVPRLRQRVISSSWSLAPPRWQVDPYFDLDYHLRWTRVAGSEDVDQVLRVAEPIAMQGFDRDRPLWEMTVIEGLTDDR